jgi:hypothetical protein
MNMPKSLAVACLLWAASPALADDPQANVSTRDASAVDERAVAGAVDVSASDRTADLQKTIDKRKARRLRNRMAYNRSLAEARAMNRAFASRPPIFAARSGSGPSSMTGSALIDLEPQDGPMYFQASGLPGSAGGSFTGGSYGGGSSPCMQR